MAMLKMILSIRGVVKILFILTLLCILVPESAYGQEAVYPPDLPGAQIDTYKTVGDIDLRLWIFTPEGHSNNDRVPGIVFFFGGGWRTGTPVHFAKHCEHLAARGMVAIAADYRVASRHGVKVHSCVADAKSAVRWIRKNSEHLGIDPDRIVAAGGSAGGHLAVSTATLPSHDDPADDLSISSKPNALVLFNPIVVLAPVPGKNIPSAESLAKLENRLGAEPKTLSPYHNIKRGMGPTVIFHGKADKLVPYETAELFREKMLENGNRCELFGYENAGHGFFNYYGNEDKTHFKDTVKKMDSFLVSLGYLKESPEPVSEKPPNIIIFFADDLGYGDLGAFGHPTIRTPHLDKLCREGQKWTDFYSAASVCTPSRAALLTGRLPIRSGMCSNRRRVLSPTSTGGLPQSEITIASALKANNYATACIGKWHLGHLPQFLPTQHGFDSYYGIPYSNDHDRVHADKPEAFRDPRIEYWHVPLMRNEKIIERPADQRTITRRYTEEAVNFIEGKSNGPFFLFLSYSFPHVPLFVSDEFKGKSPRGLYGDVVEEIDWSVGKVIETLHEEGISRNTLVIFTSDNGPWLSYNEQGGSAGLLRGGKGVTFDGGMREPTIFWWPGRIQPAVIHDIGSTLDLFTTSLSVAGVKIPKDRIIDGQDLSPRLFGFGQSPRSTMFFYRGEKLYAVRKGPFKAHFFTKPSYVPNPQETKHEPPLLFHLGHDPSEKYNIAEKHPDVIADIREEMRKHLESHVPVENQIMKGPAWSFKPLEELIKK